MSAFKQDSFLPTGPVFIMDPFYSAGYGADPQTRYTLGRGVAGQLGCVTNCLQRTALSVHTPTVHSECHGLRPLSAAIHSDPRQHSSNKHSLLSRSTWDRLHLNLTHLYKRTVMSPLQRLRQGTLTHSIIPSGET